MTPEGKVKKRIKEILKKHEVWYFMPTTYGMGRSGVPDFICLTNGEFLAIEAKAGDNQPTKLQEREMTSIRIAGGRAIVVNEDRLDYLEKLIDTLSSGA